jgi:hypothetical protein
MVCAKKSGAPLRITEMLECLGLETDAGAIDQHIRLDGAVEAELDVKFRGHGINMARRRCVLKPPFRAVPDWIE